VALIGSTFYQDSTLDPGPGYPMYYWSQTDTGLVYIRNYTDDHWHIVGDTTQPYMGCLSKQGGNMNGAITGAHGLCPADTNDFTTLYERGLLVTTTTYVDTMITALNDSITTTVAAAIAGLPSLNANDRVIFKTGVWSHPAGGTGISTHSIDLPIYSDGVTRATAAECIWGAYFNEHIQENRIATGVPCNTTILETSPRIYTITSILADTAKPALTATWFVMAFRQD